MNMLAKKAKKGFTIVELVIVIAVIAILAAVLIPTFTSVINSANESTAMQECRNEWTNYLSEVAGKGEYYKNTYYVVYYDDDDKIEYEFVVENGEFDTTALTSSSSSSEEEGNGYVANFSSGYTEVTSISDGTAYSGYLNDNVKIYLKSASEEGDNEDEDEEETTTTEDGSSNGSEENGGESSGE